MSREIFAIVGILALIAGYSVLSWLTRNNRRSEFQQYTGKIGEENYFVEQLAEEHVTISINLAEELYNAFEISNLLDAKIPIDDPRRPFIEKLKNLGAVSLDAGFYSNWVAAEIPMTEAHQSKEKLIAEILLAFKKNLENKPSLFTEAKS